MYKIIRSLLFLFDPEDVHNFTFKSIRFILKIPGAKTIWKKMFIESNEKLERNIAGLNFKNPVGLAAGFDKDAKLYEELAHCGFGFIEIGTITPLPQEGNPKKRLFRLKKDRAIINRMGFNNQGLEAAIKRLKKRTNKDLIIGGNIGKNKITPNEEAVNDYIKCFKGLFDYVDYFVVNVSSPNTPNLRSLQEKEPLKNILNQLMDLNNLNPFPKPLFLKIAPDLNNDQLDDIIEIVFETKIAGLIATNTTIVRDGLITPVQDIGKIGPGGLSGQPLEERSTEVINHLRKKSHQFDFENNLIIIGVGGIHDEESAFRKIHAGADLIQVYTGFIYEGPRLIKRINRAILKKEQ
jgi:dihydroorotate dehydrogenase